MQVDKRKLARETLAKFIATSDSSFRLVENPYFVDLIGQLNSDYISSLCFGRKTIRSDIKDLADKIIEGSLKPTLRVFVMFF